MMGMCMCVCVLCPPLTALHHNIIGEDSTEGTLLIIIHTEMKRDEGR